MNYEGREKQTNKHTNARAKMASELLREMSCKWIPEEKVCLASQLPNADVQMFALFHPRRGTANAAPGPGVSLPQNKRENCISNRQQAKLWMRTMP